MAAIPGPAGVKQIAAPRFVSLPAGRCRACGTLRSRPLPLGQSPAIADRLVLVGQINRLGLINMAEKKDSMRPELLRSRSMAGRRAASAFLRPIESVLRTDWCRRRQAARKRAHPRPQLDRIWRRGFDPPCKAPGQWRRAPRRRRARRRGRPLAISASRILPRLVARSRWASSFPLSLASSRPMARLS